MGAKELFSLGFPPLRLVYPLSTFSLYHPPFFVLGAYLVLITVYNASSLGFASTCHNRRYLSLRILGSYFAYCCKRQYIKVWKIGYKAAPAFDIRVCKHGSVIAFLFMNNGQDLITLSDDCAVRFFHNAKLMRSIKKVAGTWRCVFPRTLRLIGSTLFYSADQGIYCLQWETNSAVVGNLEKKEVE